MIETLKKIMDSYHSGLLSTPNIQVSGKIFSDEIINFPDELIADLTFDSSTFKNSHFINMKFINVNFESSFFEKCLFQNCIFENNILRSIHPSQERQVADFFKQSEETIHSKGINVQQRTALQTAQASVKPT